MIEFDLHVHSTVFSSLSSSSVIHMYVLLFHSGGLAFQSTQPGSTFSNAATVYYPKNGFITSTGQTQINGNDVVITCETGEASPPLWYSLDGREIGRGQIFFVRQFISAFNGDYNCTSVSGISATIGLYLADESEFVR